MKKMITICVALLLSGCLVQFARTHTCDATCPRAFGPGARNLMPGGPVNTGACFCATDAALRCQTSGAGGLQCVNTTDHSSVLRTITWTP